MSRLPRKFSLVGRYAESAFLQNCAQRRLAVEADFAIAERIHPRHASAPLLLSVAEHLRHSTPASHALQLSRAWSAKYIVAQIRTLPSIVLVLTRGSHGYCREHRGCDPLRIDQSKLARVRTRMLIDVEHEGLAWQEQFHAIAEDPFIEERTGGIG